MAVAEANVVAVVLDLHQQAQLFQLLDHGLPAFHRVHTVKAFAGILIHGAVVVGHRDDLQAVPLGDFKVVRVVGGGHLHRAGTELHLHIVVRDHGDFFVHDGQDHLLAHQVRVTLVRGVHSHAGIAQHGLRPGGGHHHTLAAVGTGITDMPQVAGHILVHHFSVADGALAGRTPVDHPVSAVDQALFKQAHEDFAHSAAAALVHGEAFPGPVAGDAHLPHSVHDPDLRGDGSVVSAGQPQRGIALHPVIADRRVLHDAVHGMAHMQLAGDVGRRHDNGEGFLPFHPVRLKRAGLLPGFVQVRFDLLRAESGCHIGAGHFLLHGDPSVNTETAPS